MKLKPISKAILAAAAAAGIMPFAAQAADVNVYGVVATGLYYQKTEGADNGNVGMAQYKQTPTDSHFGITGREDLGNGLYVGFQLESGYSTDSGNMWEDDRLFNRVARLYAGNSQIEVSMGRISTFTCASDPYSVFRKLRANMTASGLPGMAPATMVFNVGEMDNAIAFRTNGDDGFFVQGFYSNGSSSEETEYGWSNNFRPPSGGRVSHFVSVRCSTGSVPAILTARNLAKTKRPAFMSSGATISEGPLFQLFSTKAAMIGESAVRRTWPI